MRHFLNRSNFELFVEQTIFSFFNFIIVVSMFKELSRIQIAAIGVNLTALYALVSIARNLISGEFTQSKFPSAFIGIENLIRITAVRALQISPFLVLIMFTSCLITKLDFETSAMMVALSIEVMIIDNLRQIQILYQKLKFMSLNLVISITLTVLIFVFIDQRNNTSLQFWMITSLLYIFITFTKYRVFSTEKSQTRMKDLDYVSRNSITVESFLNHILFYLYTLTFFHLNPTLSGDVRLITAWVVNSASTLYFSLNNLYTIKLVNRDSNYDEQKNINYFAFFTLFATGLLFSQCHDSLPIPQAEFDFWLIAGTCISYLSFFIHSRIAVLFLHDMKSSKFVFYRFLTWSAVLGQQLVGIYYFGKPGFIFSSILSLLSVLWIYFLALSNTSLLK